MIIFESQIVLKMKEINVRRWTNRYFFWGRLAAPEETLNPLIHIHTVVIFFVFFFGIFGREAADVFFPVFFSGLPAAKRPAFFSLGISQNL